MAQLAGVLAMALCVWSGGPNCAIDPDAEAVSDPEAMIRVLFPAEEADRAVEVARCESNLDPSVDNRGKNSNGTVDWGLFQLNDGGTLQRIFRHLEGRDPVDVQEAQQAALNPYWNVIGARWYALVDPAGGWRRWRCA